MTNSLKAMWIINSVMMVLLGFQLFYNAMKERRREIEYEKHNIQLKEMQKQVEKLEEAEKERDKKPAEIRDK